MQVVSFNPTLVASDCKHKSAYLSGAGVLRRMLAEMIQLFALDT